MKNQPLFKVMAPTIIVVFMTEERRLKATDLIASAIDSGYDVSVQIYDSGLMQWGSIAEYSSREQKWSGTYL